VIGTTGFPDRVADAGAPGGFRINEASGALTVGGTLSVAGANAFLAVGQTQGGSVDGALHVGNIAMGANSFSTLAIGVSGAGGDARGELRADGGTLRVNALSLGNTFGGTALGRLLLNGTDLDAVSVIAGNGAGATAQMLLVDSQSSVADDMSLLSGLLALDGSLIDIGDAFTFGAGALMHMSIDGLLRGTDYGAIDVAAAELAGLLEVDFGGLVFNGNAAVFDLIRSGDANGIQGDFTSFSFINLPTGYTATAGIEADGVEVYRVRLTRAQVPEPSSWALVALALAGLGVARRWRPARSGDLRTG
jgi:hypothetical protein